MLQYVVYWHTETLKIYQDSCSSHFAVEFLNIVMLLFQLSEKLEDVITHMSSDLSVTVVEKCATHFWIFTVASKVCVSIDIDSVNLI